MESDSQQRPPKQTAENTQTTAPTGADAGADLDDSNGGDRQHLARENAQLREQVRRLMAAENKLYRLQDHLSAQQRVYVRLAEVGRTLTSTLDLDLIAQTVAKFIVYVFNYERCIVFIADSNEATCRSRAWEGYFDDEAIRVASSAAVTPAHIELLGIDTEIGFICRKIDPDAKTQDAFGQLVLLDEYFVFALPRKEGGLSGFLVAGNTRDQSRYQTEVASEGEMLVAFSNLANYTATVIDHVRAFRSLERERELLDQAVADRTRELSEALDAAQEAVRVKGEFLANVSHELRTPLNTIVNVPTALLSDYAQCEVLGCEGCGSRFEAEGATADSHCPDCRGKLVPMTVLGFRGDALEHQRFLKLLQQQGAHLLSLVEDVLDFSRLEAGRMELHPTLVDVQEVLHEVQATISGTGKLEQRRLLMPEFPAAVTIVADRTKFRQVITNLVGNAVKFTRSNGTIEVRVKTESEDSNSGQMIAEVVDDGIGIPADQIDAIFESFRQVDGSHTRAAGGAGLGLAICRQLVEMHGGNITVASQVGAGSAFRVTWPLNCGMTPQPVSASPIPTDTPSERERVGFGKVIVVDDDPAQLSMARRLLERDGYEVILVAEPKEALDTIRRIRPRLVLLDVMMPGVNGFAILSQLKRSEELAGIPTIVSTAFHYNEAKVTELGAIWLPKPWSSRTLSAAYIERLLSNSEHHAPHSLAASEKPRQRRTRLTDSVSTILYVEDEDPNWEVTELSLRGKFHLTRAREARQAFDQIRDNRFDLILMDIQLGGSDLNGIDICAALTGRATDALPPYAEGVRTDAPIVFVTAYSGMYTREELLAHGARELVAKPVDFTHLLLVISRLMVEGVLSDANLR